jgi:hypothetical protein
VELIMSACSQCKTPIGLVVTKCHSCGLDFVAFRAAQSRKANAWMKGGILFIMVMSTFIAIFNFLLVPFGLLGGAVLLYCVMKRKAELVDQPVEIFISKSKNKTFY